VGFVSLLLAMMPRLAAGRESGKDLPSKSDRDVPAAPARDSLTDEAADPAVDETLLLEVRINGQPTGKIGEFTLRRGKLMARPAELRALGFRVPDALAISPDGLVALNALSGLTFSVDIKNLVLAVAATENGLLPTVLHPVERELPADHRVIESGTGITLNYDTVGTFTRGNTTGSGSIDLRAFSPWGIASSGWLAYAGASPDGSGSNVAIRLDSAYTFADINSLRRYSLGDFINDSLSWTRPVHLEGIQVRSDFSMRPDLVTFPMPSVAGSAAVPSTVNILADGNLIAAGQVGAGPFEVPQLPVVSGAGTISMTVTNALGQQVTLTQPFYASTSLLAPHLQTFAVQSGLVRRNWGTVSNQYGKVAGTAMYRRGLTSRLTIEGSAEGTPGTGLAGAGAVAQIGNLGVVNFAAALSSSRGNMGAQLSAGAQRIGRVFSVGASAILANSNYWDVASMNGDGVQRKQLSAFISLYSRRFGSMGASYAGMDQDVSPNPLKMSVASAEHSQVASANYSLQFRRMSVFATAFKDFAATNGGSGLQVGVIVPLGRRSSVNVSGTSDGSAQLQAQTSAAMIGDWGYDAYVSAGNSNHVFGQAQYKSPYGLFTAGVDQSAGLTTARLESQGAFSLVDHGVFPSNQIYDSFAVVDTGPMPHVHVYQENRDVGKTNSSGRLLVPDMRSFDLNHISIEPTDIPPDVTLGYAARELRPQDRSGVVVKFPIKLSNSALLRIVDQTGKPIPLGSTATLKATGVTVPVGYDGNAYLEGLSTHNQLSIQLEDGRSCAVAFEYRPKPGDLPLIGPLTCKEETP